MLLCASHAVWCADEHGSPHAIIVSQHAQSHHHTPQAQLVACGWHHTQAERATLQTQLHAASQLYSEVDQLKCENLEVWRVKYELERQLAASQAHADGLQHANSAIRQVRPLQWQWHCLLPTGCTKARAMFEWSHTI